jgi:hypothetical protein
MERDNTKNVPKKRCCTLAVQHERDYGRFAGKEAAGTDGLVRDILRRPQNIEVYLCR